MVTAEGLKKLTSKKFRTLDIGPASGQQCIPPALRIWTGAAYFT